MSTNSDKQGRKLTPTQARAARRAKRSRKRRLVRLAGILGVAIIAFLFIVALFASSLPISIGSSSGSGGVGTQFPNQGQQHIARGDEHPPYNSVPATSGWHYADFNAPAPWGVHAEFIKDEVLVHNLEHGGVGIHYNCADGCLELVSRLEDIANKGTKVILSPYPNMSTTIALTAWNYQDTLTEFDEERITEFVRAHVNSHNAPEWQAR